MDPLKNSRPNIILIMTDQQRYDTIGALGFDYMDTPNLDRLVNEGTSFEQCQVTAPSCTPSRASLFTGMYPHTTGILRNGDSWTRSWVEDLNESGYHCVNIGKMHTCPFRTDLGFHERQVVENKDRFIQRDSFEDEWDIEFKKRDIIKPQRVLYRRRPDYKERMGAFEWELPEEMHSDMFVGDRACAWLNEHSPDKPLFMQIGFPGPHPPYDPSPRFIEKYIDKTLPLEPITDADLAGQPRAFKILREHNCEVDHDSVVHSLNPTERQRHVQRAYYLANVSMIDEKVGQILDALENNGFLENAVVIFVSDHGDCMTDHGHIQKWTMYEEVTRVPAIIWSPGRVASGKRIEGLCQLMDFGPTILEMAGVEVPDYMEAQSLLSALDDDAKWTPRELVFSEQMCDNNLTGADFVTMVRDRNWKLAHFFGESDGQLFDLQNDPKETINLWNNPNFLNEKSRLLDLLREWRIDSGLRSKEWVADNR
ncbi:MAG: sulfatase-like hydrolase/transferase [Opitutaceae bacterium]|nr:sulfatase-like hydrolase/transferase [Opitutaceae bacterium]